MSGKVCLYTLNAESAGDSAANLKQRVSEKESNIICRDFSDTEEFAIEAVSAAGTVIAACPKDSFCSAKLAVLQALNKKISKSSSVIAAIGESSPENQTEYNVHTAIPENGKAYPSADGMYSGFSCPTEKGMLCFVPLDEEKTNEVLENGMLTAILNSNDKKAKNAVADFQKQIGNIISAGKTIGVADGESAKRFLAAASSVEDWDKIFKADFVKLEKESGETDEEYSARCARQAKESTGSELGISVSDITVDDENNSFIAVSVADSERAKGAKVYSKGENESDKMLISAALVKLCEMLDDFSKNGIPVPPEKAKIRSHTPLLAILIGVLIAMVVCAVIAISSFASRDKLSANAVQAANLEITQEETDPRGGVGLDDYEIEAETASTEAPSTVLTTVMKTTSKSASTTAAKLTTIASTIKEVITTKAATTKAATTKAATTAPNTTVKATTAAATEEAEQSTTKKAEASTTKPSEETNTGGKWIFKTYGWGHAVGMSQQGAIAMAKSGSSYVDILQNYFPGTSVKTDQSTPKAVTYGGKSIPIVEYLCRTAYAEIGDSAGEEALKAQLVCAYTFAKYYSFNVPSSKHAYKSEYAYKDKKLYNACLSVLGMSSEADTPKAKYVDYNGSAAFTCYFDCCAGKTTSAESVWGGGEKYPYLKGGCISPETVSERTVEITAAEMKKYIESYAKDNGKTVHLDSNPENWLEILSHDSAYNSTTGYVDRMRIGDLTVSGNAFRCNVVDFALRSHCFSMEFVK